VNRKAPLLVLAALLLQSCLEGEVAGGTSTETENSVARSIAVDSVVEPYQWFTGAPTVATLRFDAGNFDFSGSADSGQDLAVRSADSTTPLPFEVVYWDRAARIGRLHVRLDGAQLHPGNRFLLFWKQPLARRSDSASVWHGIPDSQRLLLNSTLVDDFEGGSLLHSRLPDTSFWYLGGSLSASGLGPAGAGRSGNALHLACNAGQCDTGRILLTATLLASSPRSFRSMDSISLWARGTGRIWVTLEHLDSAQYALVQRGRIDSLTPERTWTSRALDTAWKPISIRPSDFDSADGRSGNLGWTAVRDSVNYLTFLIESGSEMWIDDVRFHGMVPADLR
jgi:hypothetical protein